MTAATEKKKKNFWTQKKEKEKDKKWTNDDRCRVGRNTSEKDNH